MVAPLIVYSKTIPPVHDCTHLDTCEYFGGTGMNSRRVRYSGEYLRICRMCGQKDQAPILSNHHFSVLNRPRDFVTKIEKDEYLAIERGFDEKRPEYRERVLRQVREALASGVVSMADIAAY